MSTNSLHTLKPRSQSWINQVLFVYKLREAYHYNGLKINTFFTGGRRLLCVFSVTHRCRASACRKLPGRSPACKLRCACLPNVRLRIGKDR